MKIPPPPPKCTSHALDEPVRIYCGGHLFSLGEVTAISMGATVTVSADWRCLTCSAVVRVERVSV